MLINSNQNIPPSSSRITITQEQTKTEDCTDSSVSSKITETVKQFFANHRFALAIAANQSIVPTAFYLTARFLGYREPRSSFWEFKTQDVIDGVLISIPWVFISDAARAYRDELEQKDKESEKKLDDNSNETPRNKSLSVNNVSCSDSTATMEQHCDPNLQKRP